MKKYLLAATAVLLSASVCQAQTCDDKIKSIQNQIEQAEQHNRQSQLKGLRKALQNVQANCKDDTLAAKRAAKIQDRREDVNKAQKELDEAIAEGKSSKKIDQKIEKLNEQKRELQEELAK